MTNLIHCITTLEQRKLLKYKLEYLRLLQFWSECPQKRFIVLTQSRSGSALLATLLEQHPDVFRDGEILNTNNKNYKIRYPKMYLMARSRIAKTERKPVYGCKIKYHHLAEHSNLSHAQVKSFMKDMHDDNWKIIYLRRNNVLRKSFSSIAGRQRGYRHVKQDSDKPLEKIHVDCNDLLDHLKASERRLDVDQDVLEDIPHLHIDYESDLLDAKHHAKTCSRMFEFLGIPDTSASVKAKFKRTSSDDLSETIENYEEVKEFLSKTKYAEWLQPSS